MVIKKIKKNNNQTKGMSLFIKKVKMEPPHHIFAFRNIDIAVYIIIHDSLY
jgi:hypothetical protein